MSLPSPAQPTSPPQYSARTVEYYLGQIDDSVHEPLTPEQRTAVRSALEGAMPKSNPKVVDLRINIDLLFARFYIVLFVGKDRRKSSRPVAGSGGSPFANKMAALILLVGLNISASLFIFLTAYLVKSSLGINLFARHLGDFLK
jgi:hypothetical protein